MNGISQTTVLYQIFAYNQLVGEWLFVTQPTEDEGEARKRLEELKGLYPETRYRLVKVESTVTVMEGVSG